jgi:tetratricopeptide (TPR) repeat protein
MLAGIAGLIAVAGVAAAQVKVSPKEAAAYNSIMAAVTPDQQIEAVDKFVTGFADSQLKSTALFMGANAAERKGDATKAIVYAQSALDADPKNFQAMILIAGELARSTHENDLDREEKLARADKMANEAIEAVKAAPKPNPQITDDQWAGAKKDFLSQAHEDLGMVASVRKKYDVAITELKAALEVAPTPNTTTMVRLAGVYDQAGKPDESLALLNKALAVPDLDPAVKRFAEREKTIAEKLKAGGK